MKRNRVYLPQSLPLPFSAEQLDPLPRLIAILESSFDGIFVTDAQARPIWCNHSYEVISGLTAQEVLGVPMGELVRRGTISHSATLEALAQGQAVTINQTFTTGKRAVVTSTPIYDQTDQICLVVTNVRDISELIALQETLDHQRRLSARYQQEIAVIRDHPAGGGGPGHPEPPAHRGPGRPAGHGGPHPGGDGHRQGTDCLLHPPELPSGPKKLHPGQLRRHPGKPGGK